MKNYIFLTKTWSCFYILLHFFFYDYSYALSFSVGNTSSFSVGNTINETNYKEELPPGYYHWDPLGTKTIASLASQKKFNTVILADEKHEGTGEYNYVESGGSVAAAVYGSDSSFTASGYEMLDKNNKGWNVGDNDLRSKILEIKPLIHAFGHIHESYGVHKGVNTLSINSSLSDDIYPNNIIESRESIVVEINEVFKIIDYSKSEFPNRVID